MKINLNGVKLIIDWYLGQGWIVDHFPNEVIEYNIHAPSGSTFNSDDLPRYICPFCDELDPNWEEGWCNHSEELLNEELNARNLLGLLRIRENLS